MASLAVPYDALLYTENDDVYLAWKNSLKGEQDKLEEFVAGRINGRGPAKLVCSDEGTYNMVFRFHFDSGGNDVALRCPKPGHAASSLAAEKTEDEVAWMAFLAENTNIPLPRVYSFSFGTAPAGSLSPLGLAHILMDWVPGDMSLREFLRSDPPNEVRLHIYRQVASIYIQLYNLPPLSRIGSVAKDTATGRWDVKKRPLTIDMHQFAIGIPELSIGHWPAQPLESSSAYFDFVKLQQQVQLWDLRNLNDPPEASGPSKPPDSSERSAEIARRRFKARYGFSQLVTKFVEAESNLGPFRVFIPDLDSRNMLVDAATGDITGVIDLEFANAMPAQFACDPPLWLGKILPEQCLDRGYFPWFRQQYEPLLDQFLDAMRSEEEGQPTTLLGQMPLSTHMKNSWTSDRVWFDYAATHTDQVDSVYWAVLYKHHAQGVVPDLPEPLAEELESYLQHTAKQLVAYEEAWDKHNETA
ncbi:hypothetical protein SCUCBS95973_005818 [Sporothrix curviconia]|uniref:Aminoglycoside phosphotransferase domain-containing protein n=1 Tax=Sporothrix curviconia TaxID=1260050 RepID=A0ABP0C0X9_9PEZI